MLIMGQQWIYKQQDNFQDGCTCSYPTKEHYMVVKNSIKSISPSCAEIQCPFSLKRYVSTNSYLCLKNLNRHFSCEICKLGQVASCKMQSLCISAFYFDDLKKQYSQTQISSLSTHIQTSSLVSTKAYALDHSAYCM